METVLRRNNEEVIISAQAPFVIIGESINPTGSSKLKDSLINRDFEHIRQLAVDQVDAGAEILDINVGVPELDEESLIKEIVEVVAACVDVPLCIDSANPKALQAGLEVAPGKALVNSVNGEEPLLVSILPIVKEHKAAVIGLTMDEDGVPNNVDKRVSIAGKILERAVKIGVSEEDVIIDPLAEAIWTDTNVGLVTLESIATIQKEFGCNINIGASNVSYGLPGRDTINQAFLVLAIQAGATCAITNARKLTSTIRAIDFILGRDEFGIRYISHYRSRQNSDE
jgi:5-methyltetrahydrofolate--homocysteine methyltransferase